MSTVPNRVVVGTDGSRASYGAVAYAARTAASRDASLLVVSTYDSPPLLATGARLTPRQSALESINVESDIIVERAVGIARDAAPEIEVDGLSVEGHAAETMIEYSKEARIVVLGSRGRGGFEGMLLGSVSAVVARYSSCPVIVTREETADLDATGPVVVGIDGSETSVNATNWAFSEASHRKAMLVAAHTWVKPVPPLSEDGIDVSEEGWQQFEDEQHATLSKLLAGPGSRFPHVEVRQEVGQGGAVDTLVDLARDAQLLVVGTRGLGGFRGMLLGSTSRALLHAAPCPVMVVRPESHPESPV